MLATPTARAIAALAAVYLALASASGVRAAPLAEIKTDDYGNSRGVVEVVAAVQTDDGIRIDTVTVPAQAAVSAVANLESKGLRAGVVGPVRAHNQTKEQEQWGYVRLGGTSVAAAGHTGEGVTVAVLDTGIDSRHPELSGRVLAGYDFIANQPMPAPFDDGGHGTHVAGIIAAALDSSGMAGIAHKARLLPVKVLDDTGYGDDAGVARGLVWAVDNGADIVNMSLGTYDDNPAMRAAVEYATSKGVLIVASAGNDRDGGPASFPAAYPQTIAVAATAADDSRAFFSTTGNYVDIAAPGQSIMSTFPGGRYTLMSGTSMAAPFVSGGAAAVTSALQTSGLDAGQLLLRTSLDLGPEGPDRQFGHGLMDLPKALNLDSPLPAPESSNPQFPQLPNPGTQPTLPAPQMPPLPTLTPPTLAPQPQPTPSAPPAPTLPELPSLPPGAAPAPPPLPPLPGLPSGAPPEPTLITPPGLPRPGSPELPLHGNEASKRIAIAAMPVGGQWKVQVQVPLSRAGAKISLRTNGSKVLARTKADPRGLAVVTISGKPGMRIYAQSGALLSREAWLIR